MEIKRYLAMTATEFASAEVIPKAPAWMACHFSPYGTGLTNLPDVLPPDSMIIVNDRTPPHGHDPDKIAAQLNELADKYDITHFLLDFQRQRNTETEKLVSELIDRINGTVGITEQYAKGTANPLFLTCPLPHQTLKEKMLFWPNREIWLELAIDRESFTISSKACNYQLLQESTSHDTAYVDNRLHCKYHTDIYDDSVKITLERSVSHLSKLLEEASELGIKIAIGLYQQLT